MHSQDLLPKQLQAKVVLLLLDLIRHTIDLLLDHLDGCQAAVDMSAIPKVSTDWSATPWTILESDRPLIQFSALVLVKIHVLIHSCSFEQVLAIFKLNETSIRVVFIAEEDLRDLILMANATLIRTRVSTETYAEVSTGQGVVTGNRTRWTVAWLMTQLGTTVVMALPFARFSARRTRLTASLHAGTVDTSVLAANCTWWTISYTRLLTPMRTHQDLLAFVVACFVQATLTASMARSRARVAAIQGGATFCSAVCHLFGVAGNEAWFFLDVSTFQLHLNFNVALSGAGLSTSCLAGMAAREGLLATHSTDKFLRVYVARHPLTMLA